MQMKAPDCGLLPQDGVCLRTLGEQRSGISTKKPRKAVGAGSKLYGRFVKVPPRDVALRAAHPLRTPSLAASCRCGPFSAPFFHVPLFPRQAATLTARGEEPAKLPAGSESSEEEEEEEEKLDRSSARRQGGRDGGGRGSPAVARCHGAGGDTS